MRELLISSLSVGGQACVREGFCQKAALFLRFTNYKPKKDYQDEYICITYKPIALFFSLLHNLSDTIVRNSLQNKDAVFVQNYFGQTTRDGSSDAHIFSFYC